MRIICWRDMMGRRGAVVAAMALLAALVACAGAQGGQAPDFALTNIKGDHISLADYRGQKAVLLLLTSSEAGGGQDPLLQEYMTRYQPTEKLETMMIGNYSALPEEVRQYKEKDTAERPGTGTAVIPMMDTDGSVSRAYRASPDRVTLVLVDREGQIRLRQEAPPPVEDNRELSNRIAEITK
ncbi:MAG: redoxin domain-containing protein [Chloroflexi bacterium]|nr:redoxin domain-containing protein [Chloroflexota bacterium]